MPLRGFPHSDISGSNGCTHLPGAFRSVPRPSSALDALWHSPYALVASPTCVAEKLLLSRYVFRLGYALGKELPAGDPLGRWLPVVHRSRRISVWPYPAAALGNLVVFMGSGFLRRKRPDSLPGRLLRHTICRCYSMQFAARCPSSSSVRPLPYWPS
jgi:hypothetical protein